MKPTVAALALSLAVAMMPATSPAQPVDPYATPTPLPTPYASPSPTPLPTPYASPSPSRSSGGLDLAAVQGLLAVQRLDGWLLHDRDGQNPVARRLVAPDGAPVRSWFYLIPVQGQPVAVVHAAEAGSFARVAGRKITYTSYRDLEKSLRAMLKGKKIVAMEYSAKSALPSLSRIDAGTIELVRGLGVTVRSSDGLVQFTKALWGDAGRKAHFVAVHHLTEVRKEALAFVARQLAAGSTVSEHDVQQRIVKGMTMRGLVGPVPVVAAGANSADPYYVPSAERSANIQRGDVILLSLAGKLDRPTGVYAATTWVAYAGDKVPERVAHAFDVVALARDEALALVADRVRRRRAVKGFEVDRAARAFVGRAGFADRFVHRTGHSIDADLQGGGADLDDHEVKDTRALVTGSGFTVGPGIYTPGEFGVRAEVSVYLGRGGLEVTTPSQEQVEALLAP
jgi:Xaa-Pro dipeptidase